MVNWYFQRLEMLYNNNLGNIIAQVSYLCSGGKTINATYYSGAPIPAPKPGEPPSPNGVVKIALSDGRQLTLHQTLSADGRDILMEILLLVAVSLLFSGA